MKTTITIPNALARKAKRAACKMGISRNQFFVVAILEFLKRQAEDKITERLNRVYSQEESKLNPGLQRAQLKSIQDTN